MIAMGITINWLGIIFVRNKNRVAKEVASIFERLVPISITDRYSGFLSKIEDAHGASFFLCLVHTSSCKGFADSRAISELE